MDERTKAITRALLERHPRGYVAEEAGFTVTDTAAGLFRLLCLSILTEDSAPSKSALQATRALLERGWKSLPEMAKTDERERAEVLTQAGYAKADQAARRLGEATELVLERYNGDLQGLRKAAGGDARRLRALLQEIPGMQDAGCAVFLREVQMFWPEAGPFIDARAADAARKLGLPDDPQKLLNEVTRGGGQEKMSWLVGALALVDAHDEYKRIRSAARR